MGFVPNGGKYLRWENRSKYPIDKIQIPRRENTNTQKKIVPHLHPCVFF